MWLLYTLIACFLWSSSDIANSILVFHHRRDPVILAWVQSVANLLLCLGFLCFFPVGDIGTLWLIALIVGGIVSYTAHLWFFVVIDRVDVSVMNASWAFLSIFVSVGGMLFFNEQWSGLQIIGVVIVLAGVLLLSFWHRHVSLIRTIGMLALLGFLYTPMALVQKGALESGIAVAPVFFWALIGNAGAPFLYPLLSQNYRQRIRMLLENMTPSFLLLNWYSSLVIVVGFYLITVAYDLGYVSLVAVTENTQPFFVILLAWFVTRLFPQSAPRELLTRQSVGIKVVSFVIVFGGLAMLAV